LPQRRPGGFLPLAHAPFLARQESRPAAVLRCAAAVPGASSIASSLSIAIEAAIGAVPRDRQESTMATIGTFTKTGDSFTGAVKTLSINAKTAIKPADKASDKAPDYRIFQGSVEFGAAWKKTSGEGREYLSVKLDDPSFPAPIYATLVEGEDTGSYSLIWSRRNGD
jgi:uncharacterized protein (DUF736 family)